MCFPSNQSLYQLSLYTSIEVVGIVFPDQDYAETWRTQIIRRFGGDLHGSSRAIARISISQVTVNPTHRINSLVAVDLIPQSTTRQISRYYVESYCDQQYRVGLNLESISTRKPRLSASLTVLSRSEDQVINVSADM